MPEDVPELSAFPKTVRASLRTPEPQYHLVSTHVALHGVDAADSADAAARFEHEKIAVYPVQTLRDATRTGREATGPVYALSGGTLAVPTGSVFVRFTPNVKFTDQADQLRSAGYDIVRTVSYAPNAGWVGAHSGGIAASLAGVDKLAAIPGVEEVEPQMLTRAARKA